MNKTFLTAVSAIAIMAAGPVFADTTKSPEPGSKAAAQSSTGDFKQDVKKAWKDIKKDTSEAASNISEATKDAYHNAEQAINDNDDKANFQKVSINPHVTAAGMIGKPVYNTNGNRVAKIHDIILDANGNAKMVILADGDFTGLGKLVAFDYDIITTRSADGDVIASLNEDMIDNAAGFSYDHSKYESNIRVIPNNGYSVSELLNGQLTSPQGEALANVDNIIFRNGRADQVVVSFGQTLGMGGEQAAISYNEADLNRNGQGVDFKLSANETKQFKAFQKTTSLN